MMRILGVTGGIGAGKSEVLYDLRDRYGAQIEPLDETAKQMILPGGRNYEAYIRILGNDIVKEDGFLDKQRIAARIFSDSTLLDQINAVVNPAVKDVLQEKMNTAKMNGCRVFVIESAVLFKEHYDAFCDETWYIYADDAIRAERLKESRGYDEERIRSTMQQQLNAAAFRELSTVMIDNSGSFERTKEQIDRRMQHLMIEPSASLNDGTGKETICRG